MAQFIDFGNGGSGSVSGASGTINSFATCTGTSGNPTVTTALSVAAGDYILLHQTQGTGVGAWELVKVNSTGSGQFTADRNLTNSIQPELRQLRLLNIQAELVLGRLQQQHGTGLPEEYLLSL